jgi:hypothetical protein
VIITINSGNNKLSCVVQKITIDLKVAIAIDTKDVIEALNQIEVNQSSKRETLKKTIDEMSEEKTDAKIDGRKSGMKGGMKDATIDVTTSEAREAGLVTGSLIDNGTMVVDIGRQNVETGIIQIKKMVRVAATTTIAHKVKFVLRSNHRISLGLALKNNNLIMVLQAPRATKVKYQP